jgi:hypothetical protein
MCLMMLELSTPIDVLFPKLELEGGGTTYILDDQAFF